jgi:hypothetical protein
MLIIREYSSSVKNYNITGELMQFSAGNRFQDAAPAAGEKT